MILRCPFILIHAPLINCIINDGLLKIVSDIDQVLLQFINNMNFVDSLLHFSTFYSQPGWDPAVGWPQIRWNDCRCLSLQKIHRLAVSLSSSMGIELFEDKELAKISRMTGSSLELETPHSSMHHWSSLQHLWVSGPFAPMWTHPSLSCWRSKVSAADAVVQHVLLLRVHRRDHSEDF